MTIEEMRDLAVLRWPAGFGSRFYGVHPAVVTDVDDPDGTGRVRIRLPWSPDTGDGTYEAWARLATLMAGGDRGTWFVPEVDDEVLAAFESGDPDRPYVIGALWNGKDAPPETMGDGNDIRAIHSRNGVVLTFDDTDGQERLRLETPGGQTVTLADGPGTITIEDANGNTVTLDSGGVTVQCGAKVTISASSMEVSASMVTVNAGMSKFSGVVQADAVITNSVVSSSYTPGGGPIDPNNEAHDLVMSVFGGMSKGEPQPGQGSSPHRDGDPNPDGGPIPGWASALRLHAARPRPTPQPSQGIPCPSAYDRARNPHRDGVGWSKSAIRVILTNPRYTGRQVWNKQRTDEILLDVDDVALGHTAVMRWNPRAKWIASNDLVHEALVTQADFDQVPQMLDQRARTGTAPRRAHRSRHPYVFKSLVFCGVCGRKMQGQHSHGVAYYRCRFPQEYAQANQIEHPRNVIMREEILIPPLDTWLVQALSPMQRRHTIAKLVDQAAVAAPAAVMVPAAPTVADCDVKLARYRAALDAGADPAVVAGWIAETQAERRQAEHRQQASMATNEPPEATFTEQEIIAIVEELGDMVAALRDADPDEKLDVYRSLGLRLTYRPDTQTVRAEIDLAAHRWDSVCVRGGIRVLAPSTPARRGYACAQISGHPDVRSTQSRGLARWSTRLCGVWPTRRSCRGARPPSRHPAAAISPVGPLEPQPDRVALVTRRCLTEQSADVGDHAPRLTFGECAAR